MSIALPTLHLPRFAPPRLRSAIASDAAENSIMQTITIAVSAILIAAGLVTAPGLINNARDNNATGDLSNIAYSEEGFIGDSGHYGTIDDLTAADTTNSGVSGIKLTLAGKTTGTVVVTCTSPDAWLAKVTSSSGTTFYRSSAAATTSSDLAKITVPSCIDTTGFEEGQPGAGGSQPSGPVASGDDIVAGHCASVNRNISADDDGYLAGMTAKAAGEPSARDKVPAVWASSCDVNYSYGYDNGYSGSKYYGSSASGLPADSPECINFSLYRHGRPAFTAADMGAEQGKEDLASGNLNSRSLYDLDTSSFMHGYSFPATCDYDFRQAYYDATAY